METKTTLLPAGIYMFKVNNRHTRTRCEICSKLTIKTPERYDNGVDQVSSLLALNILHTLLTLGRQLMAGFEFCFAFIAVF